MNQQNLLHSKVFLADNRNSFQDLNQFINSFDRGSFSVERVDSYANTIRALRSEEHDLYLVNYNLDGNSNAGLLDEINRRKHKSNVILFVDNDVKDSALKEINKRDIEYVFKEQIDTKKLEELIFAIRNKKSISRETLRKKRQYKNLVENLPIMFYAVEPFSPFTPIYISPEFESFGYPLAQWRNTPGFWLEILHDDDREWVLKETEAAMEIGSDTDIEYRAIKRDGSVCWIRDKGRFATSETGEQICWQGVMIDITDKKRAESLLRQSESRYRQMFEGNRSVKLIVDLDSLQIVNANPAACAFYGYTTEQIIGSAFSLISGEDTRELFTQFSNPNSGPKDCIVSRHRLVTGEYREVEMYANLLNDGGRQYLNIVTYDITERKRADKALVESEKRYRELIENANDLIYVHDLAGNYISVNKAGERIFGYTCEESLAMNFSQIIAPESFDYARKMTAAKMSGDKESIYEIDCIGKDEQRVSLEINSKLVYEDNKPIAVQGIARDITERKLAEEARIDSEERFRDLFENANDLIYTHDLQGNFTSLNRAGEVITGYSREETVTMNIAQVVAPDFLDQARKMIAEKISGAPPTAYELDIITKSGERVTLELSTRLIYKNGIPVNVQGIARDVTERKIVEQKLRQSALFDPLTNLPNRANFMQHLTTAISAAKYSKEFKYAVLFLDLDRFKVINDSLGHAIGDNLLISIAEKLRLCVRPEDVIARLGGDEFTILLSIKEDDDAIRVAERIQENLAMPIKLENYEVFTSASIGITISNEITRKPQDVLRDADSAMYQAKLTGKARYVIFDDEMHVRNMNLLRLETDLRRAIEKEEFELFYQPIIEIETGEICEFEALIRWNHPDQGLVMPDRFITIAEETGLIIPIGDWVLRESCKQLKEWHVQHPETQNISISVNLSAKQLMHPNLTIQIKEILESVMLEPEFLKLEVTESMVMENSERAGKVLKELKRLRVSLSTDDFGTGYSSLSYLHQFPFDRLKIDRAFISEMDTDLKSEAIVRTILLLGENLEIEVTAEGIENENQFRQLHALGCKRGQGYLFSKPVDKNAALKLLKKRCLFNINGT